MVSVQIRCPGGWPGDPALRARATAPDTKRDLTDLTGMSETLAAIEKAHHGLIHPRR